MMICKKVALAISLLTITCFSFGCRKQIQQSADFRIIEFHSEGEVDGFCYVTAQSGTALTYARSKKGEQWACNFLMVGYPAKRLIKQGFMNEELQVHIDMSHEPPAPNGKLPPDFDLDFVTYGGRERDYLPIGLGPNSPVGVPNCSDIPKARKWNTPCRDESGILVDPLDRP